MSGQHRDEVNPFFFGITIACALMLTVCFVGYVLWALL